MADGLNLGVVVSIGSVIGTILAIIGVWDRLTGRIARAHARADHAATTAENAMQEAAEARNDLQNFREAIDEMTRDLHERHDRLRREDGDGLAAIRQKVTEVELFMRDNFVRNTDFTAAMTKLDAGQQRTDMKLDRLSEQIRTHK